MHSLLITVPLVVHLSLAQLTLPKLFNKVFIYEKNQPKIHHIHKQQRPRLTFEGCA